MDSSFFDERRDQSEIKAEIIHKYFFAWANVMKKSVLMRGNNIAYIDLFAGPGRYKDGSASVPLLVLEKAAEDDFLRGHLVTIFNDKDEANVSQLQHEVNASEKIKSLKHVPQIIHGEVGTEIVEEFERMKFVPTFFFVDPWGYKGLSLRLINSVLKDWGCDCVFFFNYNRVNMGINNALVKKHMEALFGEDGFAHLQHACEGKKPRVRELLVIEKLTEALQGLGGHYVLPFNFTNESGERTSHYLVFVTKHPLGYSIMKDVMWHYSSEKPDGVASFSYCPAVDETPLLLEFARPLSDLKGMLLQAFAGQTLTMVEIFEAHNVGRPFVKKNYKAALLELEAEGKIITCPAKRKKNTFADSVQCAFGAYDG